MGLDMYLTERKYFSRHGELAKTHDNYREEYGKADAILNAAGMTMTVDGGVEVIATVMYWRKANAIHKWFVDNVQDGEDECKEHYVSVEKLEELVSVCQKVLNNRDLASTLLPGQSGFFFGSTEYDEWYWENLELTVQGIKRVLSSLDGSSSLYYRSSW